jgi:5-methyltetrahydrofolate--homocysteine methyltransferase
VVTTMSFDTHGRTMMGIAPERLGEWWAEQPNPPAAIGANCGIGPGDVLAAVHAVATTQPGTHVVAKANAGIPAYTKEGGLTYPTAAVDMVDYARLAIGLGAKIIGGCCGSTPAHLASIREVVDTTSDTPQYTVADIAARFGTTVTPSTQPRAARRTSRRRNSRRSA